MCIACLSILDPDFDYIELMEKTAHMALTDEITPEHFDEVIDKIKAENNLSVAEVDAILEGVRSTFDINDIIW